MGGPRERLHLRPLTLAGETRNRACSVWTNGGLWAKLSSSMSADLIQRGKVAWRFLLGAVARFEHIDGNQRGAAFAYYAFFSLFPLILVFVAVGSLFVDRDRAVNAVIGYLGSYVPLSAGMRRNVFDVISGVVRARGQAGVIATLVLFWSALRFFNALIRAVNRAWGGDNPELVADAA